MGASLHHGCVIPASYHVSRTRAAHTKRWLRPSMLTKHDELLCMHNPNQQNLKLRLKSEGLTAR